jgi:phage terminase large subunit GpA-like protein
MVRNGEWRPTAIGEPGVVGFMANELASEFSSLARVAQAVDGADTLDKRRVLENLTWGLPFTETAEISLQPGDLQAKAEPIQEPYPAAISTIVAATDVQSDRVETMFLASSKDGERWILDHAILMGDVSGRKVWDDLDTLLGRTFKIEDGRELQISASICDAGFQITAVADHVTRQRAKGRRSFASVGRSGFDRPIVTVGSQARGARHKLLVLGVDNIKLNAQKALSLPAGSPGAIHLPEHFDADLFDQLASERLESNFVRGYAKPRWTKDASVRNESFDTLVYALAVTTLVKTPLPPVNAKPKPTISLAEKVARLQQTTAH